MRRVLDLNGVSGRFLAAIGLLGAVIPSGLWVFSWLLGVAGIGEGAVVRSAFIPWLIRLSLGLSGLALAVFVLLIVIEQIQDRFFDRLWRRDSGRRIPTAGEEGECPYCGNRHVLPFEQSCSVCGRLLT